MKKNILLTLCLAIQTLVFSCAPKPQEPQKVGSIPVDPLDLSEKTNQEILDTKYNKLEFFCKLLANQGYQLEEKNNNQVLNKQDVHSKNQTFSNDNFLAYADGDYKTTVSLKILDWKISSLEVIKNNKKKQRADYTPLFRSELLIKVTDRNNVILFEKRYKPSINELENSIFEEKVSISGLTGYQLNLQLTCGLESSVKSIFKPHYYTE